MSNRTLKLTATSLKGLHSRLGTSSIIVVGIGGVVAVLIGLLAMSSGFKAALEETGRADRALVLRSAAADEITSWLTMDELAIVSELPGVEAASGELFVVADLIARSTGKPGVAIIRGVPQAAFDIRPELEIVAGRRFEPGRSEIIVGVGAHEAYAGLGIGERVNLRNHGWTVVGHFRGSGAQDSEIWADRPGAQAAFRREGAVSSIRLDLESPATADQLAQVIESDPRLNASLIPEPEFYRRQSEDRAQLIESFAFLVAGIMAIGSVIAAYSTMYSVVSQRSVEIATLRALGFGGFPVVASVLLEAGLLSLVGGLLGGGLVYFMYDGYAASTLDDSSLSQVAFEFAVTLELVVTGIVLAMLLGLVGALVPAVQAARSNVASALRGA